MARKLGTNPLDGLIRDTRLASEKTAPEPTPSANPTTARQDAPSAQDTQAAPDAQITQHAPVAQITQHAPVAHDVLHALDEPSTQLVPESQTAPKAQTTQQVQEAQKTQTTQHELREHVQTAVLSGQGGQARLKNTLAHEYDAFLPPEPTQPESLMPRTQGRKGQKLPRINMAFSPERLGYLQAIAGFERVSLTQYVNDLIERDMQARKELYETLNALRKE